MLALWFRYVHRKSRSYGTCSIKEEYISRKREFQQIGHFSLIIYVTAVLGWKFLHMFRFLSVNKNHMLKLWARVGDSV
jgi:hypothetical protein